MSRLQNLHNFLFQLKIENVIIFVLAVIGLTLLTNAIKRLSQFVTKKFPHNRMLIFGWVPLFNFALYFSGIIAIAFVLFQPGKEVTISFLASIFIALGFAIKDPVTSMVSSIILLVDKPFQVGDRITFKDTYGEVIDIGLRSVKILTLDESIVTIPNHRFLTDTVSSSSAGNLEMMVTTDLYISPSSDLTQAKEILEKVAHNILYIDASKKIVVVGKEILGISGIVSIAMKTKCIIKDARAERAFQTEFLINANNEFKKHNIAQIAQ